MGKELGESGDRTQAARVSILVKTSIFAVYGAQRRRTLCAITQLCLEKEKMV